MDLKLNSEVPVLRRCCFCLPLRRGLIGWGYARLILDILCILYLFMIVIFIAHFVHVTHAWYFIAILNFFMVDVAFTVLLVFACHRKNSKLLRVSYLYSTSWVIIVMTFAVYFIITNIDLVINSSWEYYRSYRYLLFELMLSCAIVFAIIFVQVYVILLTRSEAIKLQNQILEVQFVNNAAEAEARCVSAQQRCTDDGHASAQCTDDKYYSCA